MWCPATASHSVLRHTLSRSSVSYIFFSILVGFKPYMPQDSMKTWSCSHFFIKNAALS